MGMSHGKTCQVWIGRVSAGAYGGDFKDLTGLIKRIYAPSLMTVRRSL